MKDDGFGSKTMTAHELARVLLAGEDWPVQTEGCDCNGSAFRVEVDASRSYGPDSVDQGIVYIKRHPKD